VTRGLRFAAALTLPLLLSGCDLLYAGLYPGLYPDQGPLPDPELGPAVVYDSGLATLEITRREASETVTLDEVGPNSMLDSYMGAMVSWRNDSGWIVRVNAYNFADPGMGSFPGGTSTDVTVERIDGHDHWMAGSYTAAPGNSCVVDVWEMSETLVSGRANCRNLRWTDSLAGYGLEPVYIDGQDPFDITVTFEAKPLGNVQNS